MSKLSELVWAVLKYSELFEEDTTILSSQPQALVDAFNQMVSKARRIKTLRLPTPESDPEVIAKRMLTCHANSMSVVEAMVRRSGQVQLTEVIAAGFFGGFIAAAFSADDTAPLGAALRIYETTRQQQRGLPYVEALSFGLRAVKAFGLYIEAETAREHQNVMHALGSIQGEGDDGGGSAGNSGGEAGRTLHGPWGEGAERTPPDSGPGEEPASPDEHNAGEAPKEPV